MESTEYRVVRRNIVIFNGRETTEIYTITYTLALQDALPIMENELVKIENKFKEYGFDNFPQE